MTARFQVRVQYASGQPLVRRQVKIWFHGSGRGFTEPLWTDDHGVAIFAGYDAGHGDIFVENMCTVRNVQITDGLIIVTGVEDEISELLRDFKRDTYRRLEQDTVGLPAQLESIDQLLKTALADYKYGRYATAVESFRQVLTGLREAQIDKGMLAELCVLIASCEYHLGHMRGAQMAFQEAGCLERDAEKINQLAAKWQCQAAYHADARSRQ